MKRSQGFTLVAFLVILANLLSFLPALANPISSVVAPLTSNAVEPSPDGSPAYLPARPSAIHTVCLAGPPDCGYSSIQEAVDVALEGDVVKVAAGSYDEAQARPVPPGYEGPEYITQVVYLTKTIEVRGGYTTTNGFADPPDPVANPTILDAQAQGRVLFIAGPASPLVQGLILRGGDATGLGGGNSYGDQMGGGVYILGATATLSANVVMSSTGGVNGGAGGIYLYGSAAYLEHNVVISNSSSTNGGGIYLESSPAVLEGNHISANQSGRIGAGIYLEGSRAIIRHNVVVANDGFYAGGIGVSACNGAIVEGNTIISNTASEAGGLLMWYSGYAPVNDQVTGNTIAANSAIQGGGVSVIYAKPILSNNVVQDNVARQGAGLYMFSSDGLYTNNTFRGNEAAEEGGGLCLEYTTGPTFTANLITGNSATYGGGMQLFFSSVLIGGNAIVSNTAAFGGGLQLWDAAPTVVGNDITANTAITYGGGLHLLETDPTISDNTITGNSAGWGGGIFDESSGGTIRTNTISGNYAVRAGGGLNVHASSTALLDNTVAANRAVYGAGMRLYQSNSTLSGNEIQANVADGYGGGVHLWYSPATLLGNTIQGNEAGTTGGGLEIWFCAPLLSNNLVVANRANGVGSGLNVTTASFPQLLHNTIAGNQGGNGVGIAVGGSSTAMLTNTILVSQSIGLQVDSGSTASLQATLWNNGSDWSGSGTIITGTVNLWGEPAFLPGDYHLAVSSPAVDAGVDAGVAVDIDGQPRPVGRAPDLGADEFPAGLLLGKTVTPDVVAAGSLLTYTLVVTNNGLVSLDATILDVLPAQVTPSGTMSWTISLPPATAWSTVLAVCSQPGYSGHLRNELQVSTTEGLTGTAACTATIVAPVAGLAATNDGPTALGQLTTLTATVSIGGAPISYTWAFGDGSTGFGAVLAHVYPAVGRYTAVVTAGNPVGAITATTTVVVQEAVAGLAAVNDGPSPLGQPTLLTATVTAGSDLTYTWSLGDGTTATGPTISHTYTAPGLYLATVTATNLVSTQVATTTVTVVRTPGFSVYLPIVLVTRNR